MNIPAASHQLIQALQNPAVYPHEVELVTLVETHISWVLMTRVYAYKIKKPVNFRFLDFTSLEDRKRFCEEELRLNRRLAPEWYVDVVPLFDSPAYGFTGDGDPVEYAIKMRQFDSALLLNRVLDADGLQEAHIDSLADSVAEFHENVDRAKGESSHGSFEQVAEPQRFNLTALRENLSEEISQQLKELEVWCETETARLRSVFDKRKADGFIRECHGDMHLGNMFLTLATNEAQSDTVTLFDGIEFSESLRWIDVLSDLAFLLMDLTFRDRAAFAGRLLNRYLEHTGDYEGLSVLPFYLVYRACVRAKVAAYRVADSNADDEIRTQSLSECNSYLQLAQQFTTKRQPTLTITHGFSGSGKSWHTQKRLDSVDTIRLRSDVERKRLHGLDRLAASESNTDVYSTTASKQTYERLHKLSELLLQVGFHVIVDATFLKKSQRAPFQQLAEELGIPYTILSFTQDESTLRERIRQRHASGNDPSEATEDVLTQQLRNHDPLTNEEMSFEEHLK